jgi:trehalose 6-phosphate synthase/phosphatase
LFDVAHQIFRSLSVRDELLRGMLCASHIGFHLYEYASHFLTACKRLLGFTSKPVKGGRVRVDVQGRCVSQRRGWHLWRGVACAH